MTQELKRSITKSQAEVIDEMVPKWEQAFDEVANSLMPCAADFCKHERREHKDSCGCLHPGCECDTFITTSQTQAPAESNNVELLRLLERHHKAWIAEDCILPSHTTLYTGSELYLKTEAALKPTDAATMKDASEPVLGDSAICDGCGNYISYGPQGWTHEDSDQRGCERAVPGNETRCQPANAYGLGDPLRMRVPVWPCPVCKMKFYSRAEYDAHRAEESALKEAPRG